MRRSGFTLIEVLAVVVIIGLLAALVGPHIEWQRGEAEKRLTLARCQGYHEAVRAWMLLTGAREAPESLEEVERSAGPGEEAPLRVEPDAWGGAFRIVKEGRRKFRVWSDGPDGQEGTDDDLCYEPRE